ncbi:unnamed protein product, partial [Phaeothamnion confervicola]
VEAGTLRGIGFFKINEALSSKFTLNWAFFETSTLRHSQAFQAICSRLKKPQANSQPACSKSKSTMPCSMKKTIAASVLLVSAGAISPPNLRRLGEINFAAPTREAFRSQFSQENGDFVFDLAGSAGVTGEGGTLQTANAASFPALTGEGIAMVRIVLEPCGINIPHVHPRATELQIVIDAGPE